jgi:nucleotide-binding universal stress UspA family protein
MECEKLRGRRCFEASQKGLRDLQTKRISQSIKVMKILIATDGSEFSRLATEKGCEIAGEMPVDIRIIAAYDTPAAIAAEPFVGTPELYQDVIDGMREVAQNAADSSEAIVRKRCPKATVSSTVEMGRPAEVILNSARDWAADVIVVGSHGLGFWGRTLLGSVSNAVVHHANCPVLVVRAPHKTASRS